MEQQHPHAKTILQVIMLIEMVNEKIDKEFEHEDLQHIKLRLQNDFRKPMSYLSSLVGYSAHVMSTADTASQKFEPITSFLGKPLSVATPVDISDLIPSDLEQEIFIKKRDDLFERFTEMSDDDVFELLIEPQGTMLVRSVAKKAGIADFKDRPIDIILLKDIREMIQINSGLSNEVKTALSTAGDPAAATSSEMKQDEEVPRAVIPGLTDMNLSGPDLGIGIGAPPAEPPAPGNTDQPPADPNTDDGFIHVITADDVAANPTLIKAEIVEGDTVAIPYDEVQNFPSINQSLVDKKRIKAALKAKNIKSDQK